MDKNTAREGLKISTVAVLSIVGVAVLSLGAVFLFGGVSWITAPFRGEVDKREKTVASGDFQIGTYEDFHDLCGQVKTKESAIKALEEEREDASDARKEQIGPSITALKTTRTELINDYNKKSAEEHRKAFKDSDLPYRLDEDAEKTECAA